MLAQKLWIVLLNFFWLVLTFQPMILICRGDNFAYYQLRCIIIYRPLSFLLADVKVENILILLAFSLAVCSLWYLVISRDLTGWGNQRYFNLPPQLLWIKYAIHMLKLLVKKSGCTRSNDILTLARHSAISRIKNSENIYLRISNLIRYLLCSFFVFIFHPFSLYIYYYHYLLLV